MAAKSGFESNGPRSFPGSRSMSLLWNFDSMSLMLKAMWEETEGLMLLFWSALSVDGSVEMWELGMVGG